MPSLRVDLRSELEEQLRREADEQGLALEAYVELLLQHRREVQAPDAPRAEMPGEDPATASLQALFDRWDAEEAAGRFTDEPLTDFTPLSLREVEVE